MYNGADFLEFAIESAINQTYKNIEIIVINDGSNDGGATADVAKTFANRIIYFEKENGGVSTALNLGIDKMTGEYFSWLSHDDVYLPNKILSQVDFVMKENAQFIYSDYGHIDGEGHDLDMKTDISYLNTTGPMIYQLMVGYPINGCTTLIHKDVFSNFGKFDVGLPSTQDYDYWFRVSKKIEPIYLNQCVLKSRIHASQGSKTMLLHFKECELLMHRMAWYYVSSGLHIKLGRASNTKLFVSLIKRNFFSASTLILSSTQVDNRILLEFRLIVKFLKKRLRSILLSNNQ